MINTNKEKEDDIRGCYVQLSYKDIKKHGCLTIIAGKNIDTILPNYLYCPLEKTDTTYIEGWITDKLTDKDIIETIKKEGFLQFKCIQTNSHVKLYSEYIFENNELKYVAIDKDSATWDHYSGEHLSLQVKQINSIINSIKDIEPKVLWTKEV